MRVRHKNLYTAATAVRWATEVASALAALHEQQPAYVHNDVKADNVLLTDTSRVNAAEAVLGDLKPHRCVVCICIYMGAWGVSTVVCVWMQTGATALNALWKPQHTAAMVQCAEMNPCYRPVQV